MRCCLLRDDGAYFTSQFNGQFHPTPLTKTFPGSDCTLSGSQESGFLSCGGAGSVSSFIRQGVANEELLSIIDVVLRGRVKHNPPRPNALVVVGVSVVMDLSLPLMGGWEVTAKLKSDDKTKHIAVVILAAHALEGVSTVIEPGCKGFLIKPCLPDDLVKEIVRVLGRQTQSSNAAADPVRATAPR